MAELTPAREAAQTRLDVLPALDRDVVLVDARRLITGVLVPTSELLRHGASETGRDRPGVVTDVRTALRDEW